MEVASMEAMNFREAVAYGITESLRIRREHTDFLRLNPQMRTSGDWVVPSAHASPRILTPGLVRVGKTIVSAQLREVGEPYDNEFLEKQERLQHERNRFRASPWSRLFPMLKVAKVIDVSL